MFPYISVFSITTILTYFAEKAINNKKTKQFIFLSLLIVVIPSFLAGIRSETIGVDYSGYVKSIFLFSTTHSFNELFFTHGSSIEPVYLLLNYFVSIFTNNIFYFSFIIEGIIIFFVYASLVDNRQNCSMWTGILVFFTIFYSFTFNGVRQSLALAVVIYASKYIYNKKPVNYLLFILIAIGFHYTAIVSISFYFVCFILNSKLANVAKIVVLLGIIAVVLNYDELIKLLISFGGIGEKYIRYLTYREYQFPINTLLIRVPLILPYLFFYRYYDMRSSRTFFWIFLLIADLIFVLLKGLNVDIYRISLYCGIYKLQTYPFINSIFSYKNKFFANWIIAIVVISIWFLSTVVLGHEAVYPFVSKH